MRMLGGEDFFFPFFFWQRKLACPFFFNFFFLVEESLHVHRCQSYQQSERQIKQSTGEFGSTAHPMTREAVLPWHDVRYDDFVFARDAQSNPGNATIQAGKRATWQGEDWDNGWWSMAV